MNNLFFELIRVALGTQASLSRLPSADEWDELFELAIKQSLVGITFIGLQKLGADADEGFARIGMSEDTYFTWMGVAGKINVKNELVNQQCVKLQKELQKAGIRSSILKGQAVAALYGDLSHLRQSGDIDVYVDCGREKAIEFAHNLQGDVDWDYKHLHLDVFTDTKVEMHYRVEVVSNLIRNCKLQAWFNEHSEGLWHSVDGLGITAPSVEFNLFYILLHAYRHFLFEGVGLRQIMKDVFGLSDHLLLCEADEKEGRFILNEVMAGGNFGHHDERYSKHSGSRAGFLLNLVKRNMILLAHYPIEVMCVPYYYVWHFFWKRLFKK